MLEYLAIGGALAFAAAIQPGPSQAYLLSKVASIGWRRTLPAALAPLLSDGPIALVALVVLGQLSPPLQSLLRFLGGLLLCYFAWRTYCQWRNPDPVLSLSSGKVPRTMLEAVAVQFLNPNPYIGWALILGPIVMAAWQEAPSCGIAVVVAFYATMIVMLGILIYTFGRAQLLGAKFQRALLLVSAVILLGIGVYQLVLVVRFFAEHPIV